MDYLFIPPQIWPPSLLAVGLSASVTPTAAAIGRKENSHFPKICVFLCKSSLKLIFGLTGARSQPSCSATATVPPPCHRHDTPVPPILPSPSEPSGVSPRQGLPRLLVPAPARSGGLSHPPHQGCPVPLVPAAPAGRAVDNQLHANGFIPVLTQRVELPPQLFALPGWLRALASPRPDCVPRGCAQGGGRSRAGRDS